MELKEEQIDAFLELLEEHHTKHGIGVFNKQKVKYYIDVEMNNPHTGIFVNKDVTATITVTVQPSHFGTEQTLHVVDFYSASPGSGFRLLKEARKWAGQYGDGLLSMTLYSTGTEETHDMFKRAGLKQIGSMFDMKGIG